jgi:probable H4MPT-linked C1 transfer pathway protein
MTQNMITAWDIGGAHLKVAQCTQQGELHQIFEIPCPLWQGIDQLEKAISTALENLSYVSHLNAITMTGELVDIFPDRQTGVAAIIRCVQTFLSDKNCHIYAGAHGWFNPKKACSDWQHVASLNWHASAVYTANHIEQGLFIDIGSTTSDILAINANQVQATAFNDYDRQASSELHYTGVIRTPLIAIAHHVPFNNQTIRIAAEVFASSGDCWSITGQLDPSKIQDRSADGLSWQKENCIRRIARLLGTDAGQFAEHDWLTLARWFTQQQTEQLQKACQIVLSHHPVISSQAPIIGAGIGRFIARQCAKQLGREYIDFSDLTTPSSPQAADHAPAAAIALLASQQLS